MNKILEERRIKTDGITCENNIKTITDGLLMMEGIEDIKVDEAGVFVSNDLKKIMLKSILERIRELNYSHPSGFLYNLKTGVINFRERNEAALPDYLRVNVDEIMHVKMI